MMKRLAGVVLIGIILALGLFVANLTRKQEVPVYPPSHLLRRDFAPDEAQGEDTPTVKLGELHLKDKQFLVELAQNAKEREQGLMFRKNLEANKGMLFVFDQEDEYPFWMENTLMPLDIIWLNEEKEVVFISKNTQPCLTDFCPTINPGEKSRYVLELNVGAVDAIGLTLGEKVNFNTQ